MFKEANSNGFLDSKLLRQKAWQGIRCSPALKDLSMTKEIRKMTWPEI